MTHQLTLKIGIWRRCLYSSSWSIEICGWGTKNNMLSFLREKPLSSNLGKIKGFSLECHFCVSKCFRHPTKPSHVIFWMWDNGRNRGYWRVGDRLLDGLAKWWSVFFWNQRHFSKAKGVSGGPKQNISKEMQSPTKISTIIHRCFRWIFYKLLC